VFALGRAVGPPGDVGDQNAGKAKGGVQPADVSDRVDRHRQAGQRTLLGAGGEQHEVGRQQRLREQRSACGRLLLAGLPVLRRTTYASTLGRCAAHSNPIPPHP